MSTETRTARPTMQRIDALIGGPQHGRKYAVEDSHARTLTVVDNSAYGLSRGESVYRKQEFAMGGDGTSRGVEFFAHDQLSAARAGEYLWDYLMGLAGARWLS